MNLRHLKILRELADSSFNVSRAARALHTSQPSVSRHLHALEASLGFEVFVRRRNRLVSLTERGVGVLDSARKILSEFDKLERNGTDEEFDERGQLTIAASYSQARYSLPKPITGLKTKYPQLRLVLRQGNPNQIARWVSAGACDVGISGMPTRPPQEVMFFPCHRQSRIVLLPAGHPLLARKRVGLADLAKYPLIAYEPPLTFHAVLLQAFAAQGLAANIVMSASDVDIMKTYVSCGLGIAVVAALAYDRRTDASLRALPVDHLFEPTMVHIMLRRRSHPRAWVYDFVRMLAPGLEQASIATKLAEN
jgi:LysR family cys regulon transcriptional activator